MKKIISIIAVFMLLVVSGCSNTDDIDYVDLYCKSEGFKGYIKGDFFSGASCYGNKGERESIDEDDYYYWKRIYIKENSKE